MSEIGRATGGGTARRLRRLTAVVVGLAAVGAAAAAPASAQEPLAIKTSPTGAELICAPAVARTAAPAESGGADPAEVSRLTNAATQAMILGDLEGALEFLDRALALDAGAAEAVYLRGRILHEQDRLEDAAASFCRYLSLEPEGSSAAEARQRLDDALERGVGSELRSLFSDAVAQYEAGRLEAAEAAFTELLDARPGAASAVFNRGLIRARLDRPGPAGADLARYLESRPPPTDAGAVQRFVRGLPGGGVGPRPGAVFAAGLFPGGGQFYTRRPAFGVAVTAVAAGAVAAGLLYERTVIRCRDVSLGSDCPEELIASRETENPLLVPALGAAVGVTVLAAIEAALHAGRRQEYSLGPATSGAGQALLDLPVGFRVEGGRVSIALVRVGI